MLFADDSGDRDALTQQIDIAMKYDFGSGTQQLSVNANNYNKTLPLSDPMKYLVNKGVVKDVYKRQHLLHRQVWQCSS